MRHINNYSDIFTPVTEEITKDLGKIPNFPEEIEGVFIRNGPSPVYFDKRYYMPFDGDGMLHSISFSKGHATYINRWVQTPCFLKEQKAGKPLYGGLWHVVSPIAGLARGAIMKNTANTNIISHAQQLLALYEMGRPYKIYRDLTTGGAETFGTRLLRFTAHPKKDTTNDFLYGYNITFPFAGINYRVINPEGKQEFSRKLSFHQFRIPICHDFAITQKWAVFLDSPIYLSLLNLGFHWDKNFKKNRVYLFPRDNPKDPIKIIEIDAPPFQGLHFANAFDLDNDHIQLEFSAYTDIKKDKACFLDIDFKATFWHMIVDTKNLKVSALQAYNGAIDFPRIPMHLVGKHARFFYALSFVKLPTKGEYAQSIHKADTQSHRIIQTYKETPDWAFCEPVFIPKKNAIQEDDGWVICYAINEDGKRARLLLFDAHSLDAGPIVDYPLPFWVPLTFHGNWFEGLNLELTLN